MNWYGILVVCLSAYICTALIVIGVFLWHGQKRYQKIMQVTKSDCMDLIERLQKPIEQVNNPQYTEIFEKLCRKVQDCSADEHQQTVLTLHNELLKDIHELDDKERLNK